MSSGQPAGGVSIRGGQLVIDISSIVAHPAGPNGATGNIEVTAGQVVLSNHSTIDTSTFVPPAPPGTITFNVNSFSATDSAIVGEVHNPQPYGPGAVTIQGLQGSGSSAQAVFFTNTTVSTQNFSFNVVKGSNGGPILVSADNIALSQSHLDASTQEGTGGGAISLLSRGALELVNSFVTSTGFFNSGGIVD